MQSLQSNMLWSRVPAVLLIALSSLMPMRATVAEEAPEGEHPFPKRVPAPSLEGETEWLNTTRPLTLDDLRGKFVMVDFWTFCCINCMHVLPELKKLEHAFPNELVVIGVHSAKFESERDGTNICEAVLRYEIEHPVVNDPKMEIWNRFGIRSWPTLVLIDPSGEAVWVGSGEHKFEDLQELIKRGLPYYRAQGRLSAKPVTFIKHVEPPTTPLLFPGKVLADETGERLFIADSNHNRIVVTDLAGTLQAVIGTGASGRADGAFEVCSFNHPQGMALVGDDLYVADTENHLLRKVSLAVHTVTTIAGTGEQGSGWPRGKDQRRFVGMPKSTPLNSPWALWVHGSDLYIAMAGSHQIWRMPRDEREIGPFAGNGREDIVDGPLLPSEPFAMGIASFAQPSGLASDGKSLFVADSEGSAIRALPFDAAGRVETLFGVPGSLFDFGDVDGDRRTTRLQHPLGIVHDGRKLYLADTYNNKIKVADLATGTCRSLAGTGMVGRVDAEDGLRASFNEPGGISVAAGKLFVSDTNNHAIRVIDLTRNNQVSTLSLEGLALPPSSAAKD